MTMLFSYTKDVVIFGTSLLHFTEAYLGEDVCKLGLREGKGKRRRRKRQNAVKEKEACTM